MGADGLRACKGLSGEGMFQLTSEMRVDTEWGRYLEGPRGRQTCEREEKMSQVTQSGLKSSLNIQAEKAIDQVKGFVL